MKKIFLYGFLGLFLILMLQGCNTKEAVSLSGSDYVFHSEENLMGWKLSFHADNTYEHTLIGEQASETGTYTVKKDKVLLETADNTEYSFIIKDNALNLPQTISDEEKTHWLLDIVSVHPLETVSYVKCDILKTETYTGTASKVFKEIKPEGVRDFRVYKTYADLADIFTAEYNVKSVFPESVFEEYVIMALYREEMTTNMGLVIYTDIEINGNTIHLSRKYMGGSSGGDTMISCMDFLFIPKEQGNLLSNEQQYSLQISGLN